MWSQRMNRVSLGGSLGKELSLQGTPSTIANAWRECECGVCAGGWGGK